MVSSDGTMHAGYRMRYRSIDASCHKYHDATIHHCFLKQYLSRLSLYMVIPKSNDIQENIIIYVRM